MPIFGSFSTIFFLYFYYNSCDNRNHHPKPIPHTLRTMGATPSTPASRPKGGELSVGCRIAIVVEVALTIPPDFDTVFAPQVSWFSSEEPKSC